MPRLECMIILKILDLEANIPSLMQLWILPRYGTKTTQKNLFMSSISNQTGYKNSWLTVIIYGEIK